MSQCEIVGADLLLEFLEVAFHGILYHRNLYPAEIFVRKKIYGTGVWVSEHPEVNEYIKNVLSTVKEALLADGNSIRCVNFNFINKDRALIEKFVFDLLKIRVDGKIMDPYFLKTEEALRTICLKLSMTGAYLQPLPNGSTFSIEIETNEAAHVGLSENPQLEDFPWIIKETSNEEKIEHNYLLPIHTVKTEYLGLQMFAIGNPK